MKKVSTAAAQQSRKFFATETDHLDWIWEIATVGTACWTKPARYGRSSGCERLREP